MIANANASTGMMSRGFTMGYLRYQEDGRVRHRNSHPAQGGMRKSGGFSLGPEPVTEPVTKNQTLVTFQ